MFAIVHLVILSMPFLSTSWAWTVTNLAHSAVCPGPHPRCRAVVEPSAAAQLCTHPSELTPPPRMTCVTVEAVCGPAVLTRRRLATGDVLPLSLDERRARAND